MAKQVRLAQRPTGHCSPPRPVRQVDQLTALVLAGGLGTRLRPAIGAHQKVVATVNGYPFVHYLLRLLTSQGITRIVLCVGYRAAEVRSTLGETHDPAVLAYSSEPRPLGTAGALVNALAMIQSDPVLVLNGDSYCAVHFQKYLDWHHERRAEASIVVTKSSAVGQFGYVELAANGLVSRFVEKPVGVGLAAHTGDASPGGLQPGADSLDPQHWVSAGIYLLSLRSLRSIPTARPVSIEREVFPRLAGRSLFGYPTSSRLLDIGTPESRSQAAAYLKSVFPAETDRQCVAMVSRTREGL